MMDRRALLAGVALLPAMPVAAQRAAAPSLALRQDDQPAAGFERRLLIQWGDRVAYDAPGFTPERPSLEAAAGQFGWDARVMAAIPSPQAADGIQRAVLAVAHPGVDPVMAFPDGRDQPDIAGAMQGISLVNIERRGRVWMVADGGYQARRLTARSLCRMGGGGGPVQGVLGVTGGCATPWGSFLLTEGEAAPWTRRLAGVQAAQTGHVVELDAMEPQSVPVKRTELGGLAARDIAAALSTDGRAVVFLADGRAGGFLWRFVSDEPAREADALDDGRLYVARFENGALRWLALPDDEEAYGAAARLGATSIGRPMALALDPRGARLCLALHEGPNHPGGYVVEILFAARDPAADTAVVETLLEGRLPPAERRGRDAVAVPAWPVAPASLAITPRGVLLLGTDQTGRGSALPDALYAVPLEGAARGQPSLVYAAPIGAALGGVAVTPDGDSWMLGVAHPGAGAGGSFAAPRSRWPHFRPSEPARSAVVCLTRQPA